MPIARSKRGRRAARSCSPSTPERGGARGPHTTEGAAIAPLSFDDYRRLPRAAADHRIGYGADAAQFADLYLPAGPGPHPVVVLLHGGCWHAAWDLAPLGGLCAALAGAGVAAWSVEYRRLGNGGGWPATFTDVASGADALRTHAAAHALDLERVISLGHSTGAQLALWLAARPRLPAGSVLATPAPLRIRGVVAVAAIADLADGARRRLCGDACETIVDGARPGAAERRRQVSPAELLPLGVPHAHVVGAADAIVPADHVRAFVDRAAAHDAVTLDVVPDAGHFEPIVPGTPAGERVRAAVERLLAR